MKISIHFLFISLFCIVSTSVFSQNNTSQTQEGAKAVAELFKMLGYDGKESSVTESKPLYKSNSSNPSTQSKLPPLNPQSTNGIKVPMIETEKQYQELLQNRKRPLVITYDMGGCRPGAYYRNYILKYMIKYYPDIADYYYLRIDKNTFCKSLATRFGVSSVPITQVVYDSNGNGYMTGVGFLLQDSVSRRNELIDLIRRASK